MTEVLRPGFDYVGVSTPFYCHDGKGHILLAKRAAEARDEHGTWDPGSGELEFGVTIKDNILREVREEYGCDGEVQEFLPAHSIFREMDGVQTHWIAIAAFVLVDPDQVELTEPDKFSELGWFTLDTLPSRLHRGFAFTLDTFREVFMQIINQSR
ncbi:NUDIX domain-containing protein [Candidatus Woesebacteria bacterium]|nr:NUDIX domain-containing protein [Candidatus Woesebacteria bacterium]